MAKNHLKRKLETYQSLACINEHFQRISHHVNCLEQTGFFPGRKMRVFQGLTRELQSMISHDVCDQMHEMEDEDMFQFGKIRIEWEHYLNPQRPAFTSAQPAIKPNGHAPEPVAASPIS